MAMISRIGKKIESFDLPNWLEKTVSSNSFTDFSNYRTFCMLASCDGQTIESSRR